MQISLVLFRNDTVVSPQAADRLADTLLAAIHDEDAKVREAVAAALLHLVTTSIERTNAIPRHQAVVAALAGALGDSSPMVRRHAALALTMTYFQPAATMPQPLPENASCFFEALGPALQDPDPEVRGWVRQVMGALAPRLGCSPQRR
jgi:hypothetical protein